MSRPQAWAPGEARGHLEDGGLQFRSRPKAVPEGREVLAHNGVSAGKGHLTGAKAEATEALAVK